MNTRNIFNRLSIAIILMAFVLLASSPGAAANRTWVAPSGDDNNPCTNANPCKTFAGALAKTSAGGEIVVKESGGFGHVTINKSITIDGGGRYAGITGGSSSLTCVTIQAGNTDVIVLRGLTIKGLGASPTGIDAAFFGGVLHVENCVMSGFIDSAIFWGPGTLFVHDTVISEGGVIAIWMAGGGRALIDQTRLKNNNNGIIVDEGAQVTVRNTIASGNSGDAFEAGSGTLILENCVASNNKYGVIAGNSGPSSPTIVVISNSVVTNNQTGLTQSGTSVIYSRGNNTVFGNNTDVSGTITPLGGS